MLVQLISCPYGLFCSCVQWHIQPITPDLLDHLAVHQGKYIVSLLKWHKHCSIYVFELSCDVANICGTIFHSLHDNCAPFKHLVEHEKIWKSAARKFNVAYLLLQSLVFFVKSEWHCYENKEFNSE
jgi:hypothetical protein